MLLEHSYGQRYSFRLAISSVILPFVQENFELVVIGIILVSVVPMVIEFVRGRAEVTSGTMPSKELSNSDSLQK